MASSGRSPQTRRARLGFQQEALAAFAFLTTDYDFRCTHADVNLLTYESETLIVIVYHDLRSYEVGVDLGKSDGSGGGRRFALAELMRLDDPVKADDFRYPAVVKPDQMRPALVNLAELLKTFGGRVLGGNLSVLKQVRREGARFERKLARTSLLQQVRPRANAAFREKDYPKAVALYDSIKGDLGPAESRKLEYAKRRARKSGPHGG